MNKRIKALSIFCAVAMSISLFVGCGNSSTKDKTNKSEVNSKSETASNSKNDIYKNDNYKMVFANLNDDADSEKIMSTIKELSSEKYNGRLTGSEGNKLAAEYIESQFKELGLQTLEDIDGYLQYYNQKVPYLNSLPKMNVIDKDGKVVKELKYLKDFFMQIEPGARFKGNVSGEILYIKDKEAFEKNSDNLENKILLVPRKVLYDYKISSKLMNPESKIGGIIVEYSGSGERDEDFKKPVALFGRYEYRNDDKLPVIGYCDPAAAELLKEAAVNENSVELGIDYSIEEKKVANVIGVIPGSDDKLKDDYVIISGHFDHLGSNHDGTYNPGASDNASGTGVVLEIARIIKQNDIKPKRPIIFAAFNGEENGLFGSKYFASNTGLDMKKVAMLNADMIAHKLDNPLTLCTLNETQLLQDLCKIADEMKIPYKKQIQAPYSDHASIEEQGGQAVTFVEIEQPEYHTPKDTIEIIKKEDLDQVVQLILRYLSENAF